jgi:nicotinate-nucleotide adenylyltransferase
MRGSDIADIRGYSMKRIGIFGGTFDPPHKGHVAIAVQALTQLGLDYVYFVPAFIPPHKRQGSSATPYHRLNMLTLALKGKKEFKISKMEIQRKGVSFTVDTLKAFKKRFSKTELVLIIGADNLLQFHSWKSPGTILQLASLAVYNREGWKLPLQRGTIQYSLLKGPMLRVSSTDIRKNNLRGLSLRTHVSPSIIRYIKQHSLYTNMKSISRQGQHHEIHSVL